MQFRVSSTLNLSPSDIEGLLTMEGVNAELKPFIQMTVPSEWSSKAIFEWPVGRELFSSWILLFGFFPMDKHTFFFQEVDRRRGFSEASTSLTNKVWRHHREIDFDTKLCVVTDTAEFHPRFGPLAYVLLPVYHSVFKHRHKRLRSKFGGSAE